jgi:hypothetical protein
LRKKFLWQRDQRNQLLHLQQSARWRSTRRKIAAAQRAKWARVNALAEEGGLKIQKRKPASGYETKITSHWRFEPNSANATDRAGVSLGTTGSARRQLYEDSFTPSSRVRRRAAFYNNDLEYFDKIRPAPNENTRRNGHLGLELALVLGR